MTVAAGVKLRSVTMHPWCWWAIVRRALEAFTVDLSLENRRRVAEVMTALEVQLDADLAVQLESPYVVIPKVMLEAKLATNERLRQEAAAHKSGDARTSPEYQPIPDASLSQQVLLTDSDVRLLKRAIESYATRVDVSHAFSRGIVDAFDALDAAPQHEVTRAATP